MASVGTTWRYIKARVAGRVEERMDPAIQIEQAVDDARKQDAEFRMQAARVIANRTEVQMQLDRAVDRAATLKEQAGQALRQADAAAQAGDAAAVDKWTRSAQTLAMQLESAESLVETLKTQYRAATEQAEIAKEQVNQNALRLEELTAKRLELMGKLEQAKMQERVNATLRDALAAGRHGRPDAARDRGQDRPPHGARLGPRRAGAVLGHERAGRDRPGDARGGRQRAPGLAAAGARHRGAGRRRRRSNGPSRRRSRPAPTAASAEAETAEADPAEKPARGLTRTSPVSARRSAGGSARCAMLLQRRPPNSRNSATKPMITLTTVDGDLRAHGVREDRRARRLARQHDHQQRLLRARAAGGERQQGRDRAHDQHEQRVLDGRVHVEGLEQEVRRAEPAPPADELQERDAAQVQLREVQDREALSHAVPERPHVLRDPAQQDHADEREHAPRRSAPRAGGRR